MIIYSLITARSGSKGLKDKNILDYNGHPLIAHSIHISKKCPLIQETFVSTDSEKYSEISKQYGACVPFIRPSELAQDLSTDFDVFQHFINFIRTHNHQMPDIIIHLRPTYPERNIDLINDCIQTFLNNYSHYDSLRTVIPIDKNPQKMYRIENKKLVPFFNTYKNIQEPYNMPRQLFEPAFLHNGCVDILKTECITQDQSMTGQRIYPYLMTDNHDIDTIEDFERSKKRKNEFYIKKKK